MCTFGVQDSRKNSAASPAGASGIPGACVLLPLFAALFFCGSCSKTIGWGMLLWYAEDPGIPSGTVMPVYARSNIEQRWIAGVPEKFRSGEREMAEIPMPHLELLKNKGAAEKRAEEFREFARVYAETLQDGLPVRDQPENNARRVYRLKLGEIIKVLGKAEGVAAISSTGAPLAGDWLRIMTQNGATGYCFSYRLKLFEHETGPLARGKREIEQSGDMELDLMLSRSWYPESYKTMIASGRIDIEALSRHWGFDSGTESGTARVFLPGADLGFPYNRIKKEAERTWSFEGSTLRVILRSDSGILVQYDDQDGQRRSASFVTFPESVDTVIRKENERRQALFQAIYVNGPAYHSVNYGAIVFTSELRFSWGGMISLPRGMVSESALGSGSVDMGFFPEDDPEGRYTGAFALVFDVVSGPQDRLVFLYSFENQGIRLEYVPAENIRNRGISRADPSSLVIYFSAGEDY